MSLLDQANPRVRGHSDRDPNRSHTLGHIKGTSSKEHSTEMPANDEQTSPATVSLPCGLLEVPAPGALPCLGDLGT